MSDEPQTSPQRRVTTDVEESDMLKTVKDLSNRVATLEAGQRVLAASNVALTGQMAEVTTTVAEAQSAISALKRSVDENAEQTRLALHHAREERQDLRESLDTNTRATQRTQELAQQVHDAVVTVSTLGKLARWGSRRLPPLLLAAAALWAAIAGYADHVSEVIAKIVHGGGPR